MAGVREALEAFPYGGATGALAALLAVLLGALALLARPPAGAPPALKTWPAVGGALEFFGGPMKLFAKGYAQQGQVWTVSVLGKRITMLLGPEVSPHFYKAQDTLMSQKEVYEFNVPTFGRGVVFDVDHKVRAEQFRFFAETLKPHKLKTYVGMMVKEAEDFFKAFPDECEVDIHAKLSELIIFTASRCLMGREIRETLFDTVYKYFHDLDNGMQPISVFFPYLPIKAHRTRDKARAALAKIFSDVIQARRARGSDEPDVMQGFMDARYKNGSGMTDDQICGMLIAVLFAGQHTSSVTSTWTSLFLAANKERCLEPLLEEQKKVVAEFGEELNYENLQQMDGLYRAIKESLRMHPPLIMLMRYAHKAFDVTDKDGKTYTVPKGDICATSPAYAMKLDHVFTDPLKYDPDRFAPGREEDKKAFSFIGFGGGRHGCMGENFAYLQVKTIMSYMMRNFEMELVNPKDFPEPNYDAMVVGPRTDGGKTMMRLKRRKLLV